MISTGAKHKPLSLAQLECLALVVISDEHTPISQRYREVKRIAVAIVTMGGTVPSEISGWINRQPPELNRPPTV